jgi:hypothetical protein
MAQDPHRPADGQQKKLPHTGELLILEDGTLLIVLGRPILSSHMGPEGLIQMFRETLVVLTRDGTPALHVLDTHPSRPPFIHPWEWGWTPIDGTNDTPPPPPSHARPRR